MKSSCESHNRHLQQLLRQRCKKRSWQACSCNYPIPVYSICLRAKDVHQDFFSWLESLPCSTIGTQARFSLVCASRDRMTASEKVKVNIWDPTNWMQLQVYCNLKTQGGKRGGQGLFKDPAYPMVEMICVAYQKHIFDNKLDQVHLACRTQFRDL